MIRTFEEKEMTRHLAEGIEYSRKYHCTVLVRGKDMWMDANCHPCNKNFPASEITAIYFDGNRIA